MNESKIHYWVKQLRRPLCFLAVVLILVFYTSTCFAFAENTVSFADRFGIDDTADNYLFGYSNAINQYSVDHSTSGLWSNYSSPIRTNYGSNYASAIYDFFESYSYPSSLTYNSVVYDLTNAYIIACCEGSWISTNGTSFKYVVPQGYCCLVNKFVVSASPFSLVYYESGSSLKAVNVNEPSGNGLYSLDITSYSYGNADYRMCFTDLDIFMQSSDGGSGFTNYSYDANNTFDIASAETYYNFNYLKTGDIIVGSADPQPEPGFGGSWEDAYHYLNFRMTSDYYGKSIDAFYHGMRFNWNQKMIDRPQDYILYADYYFLYQDETMSSPVRFDVSEISIYLLDLAYFGNNQGILPSDYMIGMNFSNIKDSNNVSLKSYILQTMHRVTGTTIEFINADNLFEWVAGGQAFHDVTTDTTVPPFGYVKQEYGSAITKFEIVGTVRVGRRASTSNTYDSDYFSGSNITKFNFLTKTTSGIENSNVDNLYPPEGGLSDSVISSGNSQTPTYGGSNNAYAQAQGGTVIVNPTQEPYTMSMGEYGDMADIFNGIRDTFQLYSGSGGGGSNTRAAGNNETPPNGFLDVMREFFTYIPDQIWNVMLISVSVVSGVAVVKFVRNK